MKRRGWDWRTVAVACAVCIGAHAQEVRTTAKLTGVVAYSTKGVVEGVDGKGVRTTYQPSFDGKDTGKKTEVAIGLSSATAEVRAPGTSLVTGDASAASLHLGAAGGARMGASTEVRIPQTDDQTSSLELLKGRLFLNIQGDELKKRSTEFKLKTPAALLAVKGTKFYATSAGGEDTVGVHEGTFEVEDAARKQRVELKAGTLVSVSATGLSIPRQMTIEERAAIAEYDAASVVRKPLRQTLKATATPAAPPELVWSALERYVGAKRSKGDNPPVMIAADGTARFIWPLATETDKPDVRHVAAGRCGGLASLKNAIIGLEVRLRAVGSSALGLKLALHDAPDAAVELALTPAAGSWVDVMIPFPVSPGASGFKNGLNFDLSISPAMRDPSATTKIGGLEVQSANLICAP